MRCINYENASGVANSTSDSFRKDPLHTYNAITLLFITITIKQPVNTRGVPKNDDTIVEN